MRAAGFILIVGGFLAGAFLTALDPRTVDWNWFVPVLVAGAAGVVTLRRAARAKARSAEVLNNNRSHIENSLERIAAGLDELDAHKAELEPHELRAEIDARFRDDLARFADARESIAHLYGLPAYAEVMSHFAAGERYINRVWSAAADGYLEEARAYVTRAHEQFNEARDKLHTAMAGGSAGTVTSR